MSFEKEFNAQSDKSSKREETSLLLDKEDEQDLIVKLRALADELEIFSEPTIHRREITDVPLTPPSGATFPARGAKLSYSSSEVAGDYREVTISVPGRKFVNQGSGEGNLEVWRSYIGETEEDIVYHTNMITYLRPMLSNSPALDALMDSPVDSRALSDALWQDLSQLSREWQDSYAFNATDDTSFQASDQPELPTQRVVQDPIESSYTSSVSAVVSVAYSPAGKKYGLRIGTELPIEIDTSLLPQSENAVDNMIDEPLIYTKNGKARIDIEYLLSVDSSLRALAKLALESSDLSSSNLSSLTLTTALGSKGNIELIKSYERAMELVRKHKLQPPALS